MEVHHSTCVAGIAMFRTRHGSILPSLPMLLLLNMLLPKCYVGEKACRSLQTRISPPLLSWPGNGTARNDIYVLFMATCRLDQRIYRGTLLSKRSHGRSAELEDA